jgi:hypothetical protein
MFTMVAQSTRKTVSAAAALAIVSFGVLGLDQAHLAGAPRGTIEVGEPTTINLAAMAEVQLPEVVVVARREQPSYLAATQLPEIVVVAKRAASLVATHDRAKRAGSPSINAGL